MQVIQRQEAPEYHRHVSANTCPWCQGGLVRERRRMVDRLHSLVRPLKRYRCANFGCQWEGNILTTRAHRAAAGAAGAGTAGEPDPQSDRVPVAFVVHMVLVAIGVVFVIAFSAIEPTVRVLDSEQTLKPTLVEPGT